jgi:lactoylglutathione lyase
VYKDALGWKEIRRSPNGAVFLTDGAINVAILNWKTEKDPDVGAHGPNFSGIHHFGVEVDDLAEASRRLDAAQGTRLTQKKGIEAALPDGRYRKYEIKWAGPDAVVFDISHTGWDGTS